MEWDNSYAKYPEQKWLETSENLELEKLGEDQFNRPREKWRSVTKGQGGEEYPAYSKKEGRLTVLVTSCVRIAI